MVSIYTRTCSAYQRCVCVAHLQCGIDGEIDCILEVVEKSSLIAECENGVHVCENLLMNLKFGSFSSISVYT